ncbi:DUF2857 domain-containing protein [Pectobacterium versatile]|uniref:DUF2857 domain-containing protein n=1 Tax=Pectobacterium versatile TaxID=2488639 RepID=UPI000DAB3513|nr:DUF2857 domain-containing protein [Pectobacterium versatile]GBO48496.1 hypothetical protein MFFDBJGM_01508 [Pectobacterium versatile]
MITSLNYVILIDALRALKEGNIRYCEKLGFTYDEMNALNRITLDELFIISRATARFMNVTIHHEALHLLLIQSGQEVKLQHQINRAISLGGSLKLINQYFGLSCHETCARRRLLGIRVAQGRTPHPNENVDIDIWLRWQKHRTESIESLHALDAMMQITEQLSCTDGAPSLTAVWHLITRYEKETLIRRNVYAG